MQNALKRATVIGDGAMGTVCAILLADHGTRVEVWSAFDEQAEMFERARENTRFLPGVPLPDAVHVTRDAGVALADSELVVSAVPCQYTRSVWEAIRASYSGNVPVVSVTKGIEIDTLCCPTDIISQVLGEDVPVVALSGPSIAAEVARALPATVVVAGTDPEVTVLAQRAFNTGAFRVYTNEDLIGVELAGATKNIIALAAGIVDGVEAGDNAKAALLTRGLVEITRLGVAMGAQASTFKGLAGIGDLVTTCISPSSRNRTAGERIGRGMSMKETVDSTPSVIEGIPTTESVLELATRHRVEMPITSAVYSVLHGHRTPSQAIDELMTRQLKHE
ncbi:MAG: NAD(P)-dependent glycerol-3-phosphate dehydrogenase [bacterium]|nr:NAD(P)-dependent glycerol-3-phosphate dehydrogenase [bacterium]